MTENRQNPYFIMMHWYWANYHLGREELSCIGYRGKDRAVYHIELNVN